jgi:2-aminomuconate deaminase
MTNDKLPKPMGIYPMTRQVGDLIFVSGMGPREAGTDNIPGLEMDKYGNYKSFDFEAQVHSVFKNEYKYFHYWNWETRNLRWIMFRKSWL